jgi:hypothetical protein
LLGIYEKILEREREEEWGGKLCLRGESFKKKERVRRWERLRIIGKNVYHISSHEKEAQC